MYEGVLIATLGTQPQVVTIALDLLRAQERCAIPQVYVIHTAPEGLIGEALDRLRQEFHHGRYRGQPCAYHEVPIQEGDAPIVPDVRTPDQAKAAFRAIFRTLLAQKEAGNRVHLSIAGGRNSLAVYGMASAQLLFDANDRLWHVFSAPEFEASGAMHPLKPSDASLVQIPVLRWSYISPVTTAIVQHKDPFAAIQRQEEMMELQADEHRRRFLQDKLTPSEREVVEDYVMHGGGNREIAERLHLSRLTVSTHLHRIYGKMRSHFGYADDVRVVRETLMQQFSGYLERYPPGPQP